MMIKRCNYAKNSAIDMVATNTVYIPNPSNEMVAFIENKATEYRIRNA